MFMIVDVFKFYGICEFFLDVFFFIVCIDCFGFIGFNGVGKFIFFDLISGCVKLDIGKIEFGQIDLIVFNEYEINWFGVGWKF